MSTFIKKIVSSFIPKKSKAIQTSLNVEYIDFFNVQDDYSDVFNKMIDGRIDALVVTNVVSADEITEFNKRFPVVIKKYPNLIDAKYSGFVFGKTLFDKQSLDEYFGLSSSFHELESDIFSFRFTDRIKQLITLLSGCNQIEIPKEKNQSYLGYSVRVFEPEKGGLTMHSDTHIHVTSEESKDLVQQLDISTLLSLFVVMQKPEMGGDLNIYNLSHRDTPDEILSYKNINYNKIINYVRGHGYGTISVTPGSVVMFNAGQRWHEVDAITGSKARITAGFFCAFSKQRDKVYYWS